jgi:DNA repair protein RadC
MLYNAGDIIGISILDHIIIGKEGYSSMKEKGTIP